VKEVEELLENATVGKRANGFVYGGSGFGKSATLKDVVKRQPQHRFRIVYVNCSLHRTAALATTGVAVELGYPARGMSEPILTQLIVDKMLEDDRPFIFIFDEIQAVRDSDRLIYCFTRLHEVAKMPKLRHWAVIVATPSRRWLKELEDNQEVMAYKSWLPVEIECPQYNYDQLRAILMDRREAAFKDPYCPVEVVNAIAARAVFRGDARWAIEMLRIAGERADKEYRIVDEGDVLFAASKTESYKILDDLAKFPTANHRLYFNVILQVCVVRATTLDVYERYGTHVAINQLGEPLSRRMCQEIVKYLQDKELIKLEAKWTPGVRGSKVFITVPEEVRRAIEDSKVLNLNGGIKNG